MRGLSAVLMGLGVLLGAGVSAAMLLHLDIPGLHWIVLVGLAKLTLVGSLGLIAAGAVVRRLAIRAEQRNALLPGSQRDPSDRPSSKAEK
jgi:hypothetical protein